MVLDDATVTLRQQFMVLEDHGESMDSPKDLQIHIQGRNDAGMGRTAHKQLLTANCDIALVQMVPEFL